MHKFLTKLSTKQLYIFTAGAFGLFLLDGMIPDPIPLVDEAALLYVTICGLKEIVAQRNPTTSVDTSVRVEQVSV